MYFEKEIREGRLLPGSKLPTTAELSKQFGVNPETIQLGLKLLINQGLISRAPKRGTFVLDAERNKTLGIIISQTLYTDPNATYFPAYFACLARYAAEHGWRIRYFLTTPNERIDLAFYELRKAIENGELGGIAEVIDYRSSVADYLKNDCPVPRLPEVEIDFPQLLATGLDRLRKAGRERVDLFFPSHDEHVEETGREVEAMLDRYCAERKVERSLLRHFTMPGHYQDGYRQFKKIWKQEKQRPQGVLIAGDTLFRGIWYAMMELRIDVPETLGVVTHVNRGIVPMTHISLTCLEISPEEQAKIAFDTFLRRLNGENCKPALLQSKLVEGKSC